MRKLPFRNWHWLGRVIAPSPFFQWVHMTDRRCRLTKTDGSTVTLWLPDLQVEAMVDPNSREGAIISEAIDVVSIEVDVPGDDDPPKPNWE